MDGIGFWICLCLVTALSGMVQGVLGFGFAIVALALLPFWLDDVRLANLLVSFSVLLPIGWSLWRHWNEVHWPELGICLAGGAAGLPIGLWSFVWLAPDLLKKVTGLVIVAICLDELLSGQAKSQPNPARRWRSGVMAGFLSGLLAGSVGVPGPPVMIHAAKQGWPPRRFRAFGLGFFSILSVSKCTAVLMVAYTDPIVLGLCRQAIPLCLAALPCGWLGNRIGAHWSEWVDPRRFRVLIYAFLILAGLGMVLAASRGA